VNEAHVFLDDDEDDGFYIEETIEGSTIRDVLTLTQWDHNELIRQVKSQVDSAIKGDRMKPNEAMKLLGAYERALRGYTYLSLNSGATSSSGPAAGELF
jgi:arginine decarboxylase